MHAGCDKVDVQTMLKLLSLDATFPTLASHTQGQLITPSHIHLSSAIIRVNAKCYNNAAGDKRSPRAEKFDQLILIIPMAQAFVVQLTVRHSRLYTEPG